MAFHPSHIHPFGYDMDANHHLYDTPQQTNSQAEYYQDSSNSADQSRSNNAAMMHTTSTTSDFRKDSVATNSGNLAADAPSTWDHKHLFPTAGFEPSHGFRQNDVYLQHDHARLFSPTQQEWIMSPTNSVDTSAFDNLSGAKYETSPFASSLPSEHASFTRLNNHVFSHHLSSPAPQVSLSPPASADWMDMTGPTKPLRASTDVKHIRPRQHQPILRNDGSIRKKNAKIPIPSEITLENIDELIEGCEDEDELKQLKAQKRLLRNREAALASRQRKKKHTETLELGQKHLETKLLSLHSTVSSLQLSLQNAEAQKQFFCAEHAKCQSLIEGLHLEKEELICKHVRETGVLREQIRWYREQFEQFEQGSTGFSDFNERVENLGLEDQRPWFEMRGHEEISEETGDSFATILPAKQDQQQQQQPVTSGILFMLLLCGAFVASRSSSSSTTDLIPQIPEEVRAASSTVLQNLLSEPQQPSQLTSEFGNGYQNHNPWTHDSSTLNMHKALTKETDEQRAERVFGMTGDEYNSLTTFANPLTPSHPANPSTPSHPANPSLFASGQPGHVSQRPNLAETLTRMREARAGEGAAEVYTRSLLWETVPEDVVVAFRRLVARTGEEDGGDEKMG